jgi:hypothetical protein
MTINTTPCKREKFAWRFVYLRLCRPPDEIPYNEEWITSKFRAVVNEADSGALLCSPRPETQDEF